MENSDHSGSWEFHREACNLALRLDIHELDGTGHANDDSHVVERKRKGFWQLVHTDCSFILVFGKPPMITHVEFKVNLPSLEVVPRDTWYALDEAIRNTSFLVTSRITMIVLNFCNLVQAYPGGGPSELDWKVEGFCNQIESVLLEWKIVRCPS